MPCSEADFWIKHLDLVQHPEGGYFKETYRADEEIPDSALPTRYTGNRSLATLIYFLLPSEAVSKLHRIASDEIWHFYTGSPLAITCLHEGSDPTQRILGPSIQNGQHFHHIIPRGTWFGAEVLHPDSYTLVGCTVAPGFDFKDFELGDREMLTEIFPEATETIQRLT